MTVGEEGRAADDKEGRQGVGAGHVWLNVCVWLVRFLLFFLAATVVVVLLLLLFCLLLLLLLHTFSLPQQQFTAFFICHASAHTHTYLPHTHVLATHTARCSENFAVKLASLLKQTKFA